MRTVIFLALLVFFPLQMASAGKLPDGIIKLDNTPATNFTISDYDGNKYSLSQSRGKWVFLHFWASWCGPCRREMPILEKLKQQFADKPIDFVLINTAEDEDTIFSFLGSVAPSLHSYMDRDGKLTELWAPRGLPTTFFVDPKGNKRFLALGGRPWDTDDYQDFLFGLINKGLY